MREKLRRLRTSLAWWVFSLISDYLDPPEMTDEDWDRADDEARAHEEAMEDYARETAAEAYQQGREDAMEDYPAW